MEAIREIQAASWSSSFLETSFRRSGETRFEGHVFDPNEPGRTFTIDVLVDGTPIKTALANEFVQELLNRGFGKGCYGFSLSIGADLIRDAKSVEARVSNFGTTIGTPIELMYSDPGHADGGAAPHGSVQWLGGLRFSGWIGGNSPTAPSLDIFVDGGQASRVKALGWAHQGDVDDSRGRAVRAFDFQLPDRYADGCVHQLKIVAENGDAVGQGALPFVAFRDGLAAMVSALGGNDAERLRGELFDQLMPKSLPMSQYGNWRECFPIAPPAPVGAMGAVVLLGAGEIAATLSSLDDQMHNDWIAVTLELTKFQAAFDPDQVRLFLEGDGSGCEFVLFALSGTVFVPDALARIARTFSDAKGTTVIYGDVDFMTIDGGKWPLALPAFDYERMLEQGYCAHLFAMRRETALRALRSGASNLYRLFNAIFDGEFPESAHIAHLPGSLGTIPPIQIAEASEALSDATRQHLAERNIEADVVASAGGALPAVHVTRSQPTGHTTVVIPTRNRVNLLRRCLESIAPAIEKASADVLIIDNDSSDPETCDYLNRVGDDNLRVLRVAGPFNFSRLNNIAVDSVTSDYVCLLNNDVEAMDDRWLAEMLGRISEPDVGAVGALLLWPSGVIQHGGVVMGASFAAHHAFNDRVDGDPGPGDILRVAHECSAVTAACMLTRREDYLEVGGMDELNFSVAFNDIDYCLKLRALERRIVFTPHARLWHLESASRGRDIRPDRKSRFNRELRMLREKWSNALLSDPYYNPVLSLDPVPYSALAWPPRSRAARWCNLPIPTQVPSGM
jgi:GT2 family glycosyltransferase